jgi:glycosyltransferase involved in cell wall biosynthesis
MNDSENNGLAHKNSSLAPNVFFGPEIWPLQNHGGISRYYGELIRGMVAINKNTHAFIPPNDNHYIEILPEVCRIQSNQTKSSELIRIAKNRISKTNQESIYHATYFSDTSFSSWKKAGFKTVITVFDLISEKYPEKKFTRPRFNLKKRAIKSADHIICISNTTKSDLIEFYGIPEAMISVVYLGSELRESGDVVIKKDENNQFLLYVGKRAGYKNFSNFLTAYAQSDLLKNKYNIIAFGGSHFDESEIELIEKLRIENRVLQVNGNDDKLIQFYSTATAFIYPSLYEGFGLPPLEAMKYGCPVLASNKGSIPEICNKGAIYFDATSIDDMRAVMEESLNDTALLEKVKQLGAINTKRYTWRKTSSDTADVYSKLFSR